ncbi:MAG: hypothetical protein NTZ49_03150 [Candidatus Parcubacteria bacterium]|nr:hypothetical protein [Candidatus Parcubacteria bacterium]
MTPRIKITSYANLVNDLLVNLPERERQVLQRRNALGEINQEHTLEQIGRDYNITRERVRQIEREGLRKLKVLDLQRVKAALADLESQINENLQYHGGLMSESHLVEKLLQELDKKERELNALNFLLINLLDERFERIDNLPEYDAIWKLAHVNMDELLAVSQSLKEIIADHGQPIHLEDLMKKFNSNELYSKVEQLKAGNDAIIEALLRARKDVKTNILKQWGLAIWNTIRPKRMTDKAYLIMLREKRPLHFVEVADLINQANFDGKKACPATVHNELILDNKYVLVGRGTYALKEWGYQPGTVSEIIVDILKQEGSQAKQELIDKVLKQRFVQKTTIILALMDKNRFQKQADGRYNLAA